MANWSSVESLQLCLPLTWGGTAGFLVRPFRPGLLNSRSAADAQKFLEGPNLKPMWSGVLTLMTLAFPT